MNKVVGIYKVDEIDRIDNTTNNSHNLITLDLKFMNLAINEAKKAYKKDEVPIGAVLVADNSKIIAKAHNLVQYKKNTCYHAEFLVIQKALKKLNIKHLLSNGLNRPKYTLYTTLEPCPMCAGAIVLSKIDRVVIAALDPKSGSAGSVLNILQNDKLNHKCNVEFGILENESSTLLKNFFSSKRKKS